MTALTYPTDPAGCSAPPRGPALRHLARPLLLAAGVAAAAAALSAPAHADDTVTSVLNGVGIGNNGVVSSTVAGVGQSMCPTLASIGSTFATMAAQMTGSTGLATTITGWVVSMAIQAQCPGFMTSLANGSVPNVSIPQVPGVTPSIPGF